MPDTFTLTIIFLIFSAFVASIIKGRVRDKCLLSFSEDMVTADFIELMDIDYKLNEEDHTRRADIVVSRKCGFVRHLGERRGDRPVART